MKILLLNPRVGGVYEVTKIYMPPLGLLYIGTVLKQAGHSVTIRDLLVDEEPPDYKAYDLVGISCTTGQFNDALRYARRAHEARVPVVIGGAHPTFTVDEMLGTGVIDYVVRGEGERTVTELAEFLQGSTNGAPPENIKGLSWRDGSTGEIINNDSRPFIEDINELPMPDRSLLSMEKYKVCRLEKTHPATTLITSRGCPYDCSFCVATQMTGKKWRYRSVEKVINEVEDILGFGFTGIFFVDDNLTASPKRVFALCDELERRGLDFRWWAMSRCDTIAKNEDMVRRMAACGCGTIFLGLESPSDKVLKSYNKKSSADIGAQAVKTLKKHRIRIQGSFIVGSPIETEEDMFSTLKYAQRLNPKICQFSLLTPYPGTRIYHELREKITTKDWNKFDGMHAVFESDYVSCARREEILHLIYKKYYRRLGYLLAHWKTINLRNILKLIKTVDKQRDKESA